MADENATMGATASVRDALADKLMGTNRRMRQDASHRLAAIARANPALIAESSDVLIDALSLPEAQTRWECLDALSAVALVAPDAVEEAFAGAEEALFDEGSPAARLSAFRFLARYGASAQERSSKAWPIMAEALQCYHGDPEYREMLVCLRDLAQGHIADSVRAALVERMTFDSKYGRGIIRARSAEVCALAKGGV